MKVFGTRFWGFNPQREPFVGFTYDGSRNALIAKSAPGDRVVILGTTSEPTKPDDRGKLLGLIEFERTAAFAEDLVPEGVEPSPNLLDENGRFRWPYAVPALRAWRFDPPQPVVEVIGRQLTMAATTGIDELSDEEASKVLSLPSVEIDLGESRAKTRAGRIAASRSNKLSPNAQGQPGPAPSEWSAATSRCDGPTATYLFRFGKRNVWKIGISQNPSQRCKALNFSIPKEVLNEEWVPHFVATWPNGAEAYAMEQALLSSLSASCTVNERVMCSEAQIAASWSAYLRGQ